MSLTHCAVCSWVLASVTWVTYLLITGDIRYLTKHSTSYDKLYSTNTTDLHYNKKPEVGFLDAVGADKLSKNTSETTTLRAKLQDYEKKIYRVNSSSEQCTMVIQTYKRTQILPRVVKHYCTMVTFSKVLVIWNDVNTSIPDYLIKSLWMCSGKLQFIVPKENLLTNRFMPRKEIETDCKFVL